MKYLVEALKSLSMIAIKIRQVCEKTGQAQAVLKGVIFSGCQSVWVEILCKYISTQISHVNVVDNKIIKLNNADWYQRFKTTAAP